MKFASMAAILMLQTSFASETLMTTFESLTPPKAQKKSYSFTIHDRTINDPYAWLRDSKWTTPEDSVKDEEILQYIQNENKYRDAFFEGIKSTVGDIFLERKGYIAKVDESVPIKRDNYFYYSRQKLEQNYRAFYRKKGSLEAEEELVMDVNAEALNYTFFSLGYMAVSPSHQFLAYSADTKGNEFFELRIRDIAKQKELSDVIPSVASLVWLPDSSGFYYLQYNKEWRTKKMFFHQLGEEISKDKLVYEEKGEIPSLGIQQSFDKKYLFLNSDTKEDSEIFYIDLSSDEQKLQRLINRVEKRLVSAEHRNGDFYFLMNDTGSNFRLAKRPVKSEKLNDLTEVIAHHSDVYLRDFVPYAQGVVLATRENGLNRIAIYDEDKKEAQYIKMPDETYDLRLVPTTYDDSEIRYSYSSLAKPETVFATTFNMETTKTLKVQEIPSGFEAEQYVAKRVWAKARDGVKVPISLVYRKDKIQEDGENPLLLYGYGSYGYGIPAGFSSRALSYVNHGFVFAIAHIRGGDDLGYQWYLDGKLLKKKNTFNDFIDAAGALIQQGYTTQGMIAAMGGSAGGLLMGAIANERPELFKAIVAHVPFVDVVSTMLDETLPLTPGEFVEWGNPKKDKTSFEYMLSYSPYDNVKSQVYPAIYMTGGLTDPRVTYWEPTKWLAKLREHNKGKAPLLMKMHMEAGHAGGSKRDEGLREDAEDLAFLLKVFGKI